MGNKTGKHGSEFEESCSHFSAAEMVALRKTFRSMAAQSRSKGEFVIASVFQAFHGIHGSLGARLFDILTHGSHGGKLFFEDFVIAKAALEKGSASDLEEMAYSFMDLLADKAVSRSEVEAVLLSILETVLGPKESISDASVQAFLAAANFSDPAAAKSAPVLGPEPAPSGNSAPQASDSPEPCMSLEDFRQWCQRVPAVRKFLSGLLTTPSAGLPGREVPVLKVLEEERHLVVLQREHAWHIAAQMQEKDTRVWALAFSSRSHGGSFNTFMGRVSVVQGPTVVVVRDKGGAVFGGFASQPWARHSAFYGDMKSFLFQLLPTCAIFRPSGSNANLQWCAANFVSESLPNGFGFGGQVHHFGLFVNASLEAGQSRPSVTFNSPSLSSTPDFVPDVVEVWAIVQVGDQSEIATSAGAGTILERFKEDRAMLNLVGIANASDAAD